MKLYEHRILLRALQIRYKSLKGRVQVPSAVAVWHISPWLSQAIEIAQRNLAKGILVSESPAYNELSSGLLQAVPLTYHSTAACLRSRICTSLSPSGNQDTAHIYLRISRCAAATHPRSPRDPIGNCVGRNKQLAGAVLSGRR